MVLRRAQLGIELNNEYKKCRPSIKIVSNHGLLYTPPHVSNFSQNYPEKVTLLMQADFMKLVTLASALAVKSLVAYAYTKC